MKVWPRLLIVRYCSGEWLIGGLRSLDTPSSAFGSLWEYASQNVVECCDDWCEQRKRDVREVDVIFPVHPQDGCKPRVWTHPLQNEKCKR